MTSKLAQSNKEVLTVEDDNSTSTGIIFKVADSQEIIRIANDGRIFWKQREVETDADFRKAMVELRDALVTISYNNYERSLA